jgi:hypothetical protein
MTDKSYKEQLDELENWVLDLLEDQIKNNREVELVLKGGLPISDIVSEICYKKFAERFLWVRGEDSVELQRKRKYDKERKAAGQK